MDTQSPLLKKSCSLAAGASNDVNSLHSLELSDQEHEQEGSPLGIWIAIAVVAVVVCVAVYGYSQYTSVLRQ